MGEANSDKKKNGLGMLLFDTGEIFFGCFKNDQIQVSHHAKKGAGIYIFCTGHRVCGNFHFGRANGNSVIVGPVINMIIK